MAFLCPVPEWIFRIVTKMRMYDTQIIRRAKMILKPPRQTRISSLTYLSEQERTTAAGISQKK
jgi:hypothetical protein